MLGESLGEPVGKRLDHDCGIIVVRRRKARSHGLLADAGRHREAADIIGNPAVLGRDEIGKGSAGTSAFARHLLAQRVERRDRRLPFFIGEKLGIVVASRVGRPKADDAVRRQPLLAGDLAQHRLRVLDRARKPPCR